ncbi:cleavage and polyadenylation specificity factor subunit 6-like [Solea solea]|uniref:cleavage and polyadenylation specificity factor subunit 6-like n=1 Tax=Solea solea TaxID=90069 RepID=UPI00272C674E|nr:cleavage and polyadenylation specificity factor subunit 6-like [Solea solea]
MMWTVVILLAAALHVESYGMHGQERLFHGRQLKIYLNKNCDKLEFIPADDPYNSILYWDRLMGRVRKGRVSGTGSDRRWFIEKVTYEDQGTYVQRDFWNKEVSTIKVAVTTRLNFEKCVAGESLYIPLEGLDLADAELIFTGQSANVTLVHDGAPVGQNLPDYWNRVETHSQRLEIKSVNTTDEGRYLLKDRKGREVSITKMDLTDRHETTDGNPLMALLLLLGIPAGICCCCRKKIFKKKATTAATLQTTPDAVHPPPSGPVGPSPPYSAPGQPGTVYYHGPSPGMGPAGHPPPAGPGQWNGPPPSPGYNPSYPPTNPGYPSTNPSYPPTNPGYPPTNPGYPTAGPGMGVPAQPPHWNAPPGQYPPGPGAPMGYAPVMYSAPPPAAASEPVKEQLNSASSPADPLLTVTSQGDAVSSPVPAVPPTTTTLSSDGAYKFDVGDNSSNFL